MTGEGAALRRVLAANLRHYRKQQGLSQEALAAKAGLHRTYVSHIEQCRYGASVDNIAHLAKALEVAAHLLFIASSPEELAKP